MDFNPKPMLWITTLDAFHRDVLPIVWASAGNLGDTLGDDECRPSIPDDSDVNVPVVLEPTVRHNSAQEHVRMPEGPARQLGHSRGPVSPTHRGDLQQQKQRDHGRCQTVRLSQYWLCACGAPAFRTLGNCIGAPNALVRVQT